MALTQTQVSELYVAIFNRASEGSGNTYWQSQGDLAEVANKMLGTDDAKAYFGDALNDDKAFVEWIYKNTFNKTYADDPKGIDYWVGELAKGATRGEVIANMVTAATDPENAGDAQDQFMNRVAVSDYLAEHFAGDDLATSMPDYKTKLGFDGDLKVTKDGQTVADAEHLIDTKYSEGLNIDLTPKVDTIIGTDKADVYNATSSTLGVDDNVVDPSVTDKDTFNIALTADMAAATITNVENINVTLNTLGGTKIDADNITGANITVGSTAFGFSGAAEIDNLGKNDATAGQNITDLTVKGIKSGTIDTGNANQITATVESDSDSISLKVHGDVALDATAAYTNLTIDADKDAVVDVSDSAESFTGKGEITGAGNVTIKTKAEDITAKEVKNSGTGTLTVELTDNVAADLKKVDTDKVITDEAYTNQIDYNSGALDVTAKKAANDMKIAASEPDTSGGSIPNTVTVHLIEKADDDKINTTNVGDLTVEAQKAGTIAEINKTNKDANVTLINGANELLTVTDLDAKDKSVIINDSSKGNIKLEAIEAAVLNASSFAHDLDATQSDDEAIAIVGAKGKNNITTAATNKTVSITTQDSDDTVTATSVTSGKLTINTAGGQDKVTATALEGKANIDLGAGDDTIDHIKGASADADITVTAGDGKDSMTIDADSDGKLVADMGAGDDTVDMSAGVKATAKVELSMGDGNDTIKAKGAGAETLTFDGGAGTDTVDVLKDSDFTNATLTLTAIENVKIDTKATFNGDQLSGQTFTVSGTADDDQLIVNIKSDENSDKTTDLSTVHFDNTMSTGVEYAVIDASNSKGNDTIKSVNGIVNHIILGAGNGKDTVQLSADSMGVKLVDVAADGIKTDEVKSWDPTKADFNIAVVENFESTDDSLVLGDAASTSNYRDVQLQIERDDSAAGKDLKALRDAAIEKANDEMAAHSDVEYVYAYNTGKASDNSSPGDDSFLLWDTNGDHKVDAAILLVGINSQDAFDHTDIVAAS